MLHWKLPQYATESLHSHIAKHNGNQTAAHGVAGANAVNSVEEIRFDGLRISIPQRRVEVHGQVAALTAKEFDLLVTLASAPGRVFTRETLLEHIWGYTFLGDGRTVDVHIGTLRKKLEVAGGPGTPHYIKTVWGLGYKFDPEGYKFLFIQKRRTVAKRCSLIFLI